MSRIRRFLHQRFLDTRKWFWRLGQVNRLKPRPLFIFGAQRSGTTMLGDCLNQSVEVVIFDEASDAMDNWRLKDNDTVLDIIGTQKCLIVGFKPLTDSHRAIELLGLSPGSVAIWMYRRPADRANSAVAKFGDHNREYLSAFVRGELLESWQAQGLSEDSLRLLRTFDFQTMSPHSAAGLFWYIRNSLYFEQKLFELNNVLPLAYEDLVSNPEQVMRGLCRFLGCAFSHLMVRDIHASSVGRSQSKLGDEIELLCNPLYERLHLIQQERWLQLSLGTAV